MTEPLHFLTIGELAAAYRRRNLSPVEVTRAQLDRIAALNPALHAYIAVLEEEAMAEAARAQAALASRRDNGPLMGVPVGVKDLLDVAGVVTTAGATGFDYVPDKSAPVVRKLRSAGVVLLGKHQMVEFAGMGRHGTDRHPAAVNPWNEARITGMSSSGTGVAVAAGLGYAGIGSDTGGSIRSPSAYCGIVGLKPTFGLVPVAGLVALAPSLDHLGPMTRSVEDAALVLQVLATGEPGAADYLTDLRRGVEGLRIAMPQDLYAEVAHPEVADALQEAADVFRSLGAEVFPVPAPAARECIELGARLIPMEFASLHAATFAEDPDRYSAPARKIIEQGLAYSHQDRLTAAQQQRRLGRAVLAPLYDADLLLTPGAALPAPVLGALDTWEARHRVSVNLPFNIAGIPAICVPAGVSRDGLPLSISLAARPLFEATLLRAAFAYEDATGWHTRHPALHV